MFRFVELLSFLYGVYFTKTNIRLKNFHWLYLNFLYIIYFNTVRVTIK